MMKLSEAMRLGAMMKPQGFGHIISFGASPDLSAVVLKTCALGAALDAAGRLNDSGWEIEECNYPEEWRPLLYSTVLKGRPVITQIAFINDTLGLTREQIADWVETIERDAEQAQTPAPSVVEEAVQC